MSSISEMTTVAAVIISGVSAIFALVAVKNLQWIAMNDVRVRLLEERMKVYHSFKKLVEKFSSDLHIDSVDLAEAQKIFETSYFIFSGLDVHFYLEQVIGNIKHHQHLSSLDDTFKGENSPFMDNQRWLIQQNIDGIQFFRKHMSVLDTYRKQAQP
ncbi:Uncharacterised protein [Serratia quinivorans]|uniref:hypothetical protein n=1 Tax=Serratia quinivorans TaxID=137545 RepID=UPI002179C5CC|nr:hypothetical protein [Serratia quinivorans]CAI1941459.1 Uncharacterised protein [Serratia quinivorans]